MNSRRKSGRLASCVAMRKRHCTGSDCLEEIGDCTCFTLDPSGCRLLAAGERSVQGLLAGCIRVLSETGDHQSGQGQRGPLSVEVATAKEDQLSDDIAAIGSLLSDRIG